MEEKESSPGAGIKALIIFNVLLSVIVSYLLVRSCLQGSKVSYQGEIVGGKNTQGPNQKKPFNFLQGFMSLDDKRPNSRLSQWKK